LEKAAEQPSAWWVALSPDLLDVLDAKEVAAEEEVTQISAKSGHVTEHVSAATGATTEPE